MQDCSKRMTILRRRTLFWVQTLPITIAFALLTAVSVQANTTRAIEDLASEIEQTSIELDRLEQQRQASHARRQSVQAALNEMMSNRDEQKDRSVSLSDQLASFEDTLSELDSTMASHQARLARYKAQLALNLQTMQRLNRYSDLQVLLQHQDPAEAHRLHVYRNYFLQAQQSRINQQTGILKTYEATRLKTLKDRNWLNHIKRKVDDQYQTLASSFQKKAAELNTIDQSLRRTQSKISQLRDDEQRLLTLLQDLETVQSSNQSGYFEALKGQHQRPVDGSVAARFGDAKGSSQLRWSGWFIEARVNSDVSAIADGEIIYSGWLEGFGTLVIIDHGDGFTSLYGGNRSVKHDVGHWVESGSTIATVGDSGGHSTSGLYFEIRQNAQALDPVSWLAP